MRNIPGSKKIITIRRKLGKSKKIIKKGMKGKITIRKNKKYGVPA